VDCLPVLERISAVRTGWIIGVVLIGVLLGCSQAARPLPPAPTTDAGTDDPPKRDKFGEDRLPKAADVKTYPIDGDRVVKYVKQLCDLGPRVSGSDGMAKQQKLLTKHFEDLGGKVTRQDFRATQRSRAAAPVAMCNLVVSFFPDRKKRIIFCSHYDTRPSAHEETDRNNWNRPFLSANDGTGGAAMLMELAHHLKDFPTGVGVDLVLFDGEEYIFEMAIPYVKEGDKYFFGSEHFAAEFKKAKAAGTKDYAAAILLDLCQAEGARLAIEGHSWASAPQLVTELWRVAAQQGAKSFKWEQGYQRAFYVTDDHIALNEVGIPAVDVLDFDYPHWHKLTDTPDKISPKQCVEVGTVLLAWLQLQK